MRNRPLFDVVALLARCGIGTVFLAHGWQKIQVGVAATGRTFDAMGVPAPTAAAVYATFVELLAGAALILGVAVPVAGTLLFLDMAGAFVFVHAKHGILLVDQGNVKDGYELVLVLGLASLLFAAGGGGRLTLDHRLAQGGRGGRRPPRPALPAATGSSPAAASPSGLDDRRPDGADAGPSGEGSPVARTPSPRAARTGEAGTAGRGDGSLAHDDPITGTSGTGDSSDAETPDEPAAPARTAPVRRSRTGRGTAGTSRDVPVAGMKRNASADGSTKVRRDPREKG